jgi:hypothetical protein
MSLQPVLLATPVHSIESAVAVMEAIDAALPDDDGVKWFNRLYLRVTVAVGKAVGEARFHDAGFLRRLDVEFANLYFSALASGLGGVAAAPSAWRPLLESRSTRGIARLQFALAGMNAHINRDLPEGIIRSFTALGGDPLTADQREQDFDSVNGILEQVEQDVKIEFATGIVGSIDRIGGPVDDAVAMWKVRAARSTAWTNAQVLWGLRHVPRLRDRFFTRLDSLVGMAGRALLVPCDVRTASRNA